MESYLKTDVIASSGKRFYWCTWFRDINQARERVYYSILIISQIFLIWYIVSAKNEPSGSAKISCKGIKINCERQNQIDAKISHKFSIGCFLIKALQNVSFRLYMNGIERFTYPFDAG